MEKLQALMPSLRHAVTSNQPNASSLVSQARLLLTEIPDSEIGANRDVLELAVAHAVQNRDWRGFDLLVAQLLPLYSVGSAAPSVRDSWRLFTGLQLMHHLVEARLAEFHTRVEALSEEDISSAAIAFPLSLEALLLEGGYNKILNSASAGAAVPHALFAPFLSRLETTVRDDIADCAAAAYGSLTVPHALTLLRLSGGEAALASYISSRGLPWLVQGGRLTFAPAEKQRALVEASTLLCNSLGYCAELEKIV